MEDIDYESLDANVRCYALVGRFLYLWNLMEADMMGVISKALKLHSMQASILSSNVQFRDKVHILRSAIHVSDFSEAERANYKKKVQEIADYAPIRNMIAHDVFHPGFEDHQSEGVSFLGYKAKGSVRFSEVNWSVSNFLVAFAKLESFQDLLFEIEEKFKDAQLLDALMEYYCEDPMRALSS